MKKFIVILAALAVAVAFAAPAMADVKLTSKGYMDVTGIYVKSNILDDSATHENEASNAYYQMEMLIDPVLHINDKVRIHARITVMNRTWNGSDVYANSAAGAYAGDYRAWSTGGHDFWWEYLYMSFPLATGTLYVGRMGGGTWAYAWQDYEDNRDRVKWIGKVGHVTIAALWEKLSEGDGGAFINTAPAAGDNFDENSSDVDAYALGAVVPFSKAVIYRPLIYFIKYQDPTSANGGNGEEYIFMNGIGLNFGVFKLDAEINYRWGTRENWLGTGSDLDRAQLSGWAEGTFMAGPAEIGLGIFYLEGEDSNDTGTGNERATLWGVQPEFQPTLLLFSEDMGLLFGAAGVPNGTNAAGGLSGFEAAYLKAGFKLSDTMKLKGIFAYVNANEMIEGSKDGGGVADDHIGMELNVGFEWQFLPNIKYVIEGAYLMAGDYFADTDGDAANDLTNDPYGVRHMLVINW